MRNYSKWSAEQMQMIRERYTVVGPTQLAAEMGVSIDRLTSKACHMGVGFAKPFEWSADQLAAIQTRYAVEGPTKLSKELGVPYWVLLSKAKRLGIEATRKRPPKNFRWTPEFVGAVAKRYVSESPRKLAEELGVTEMTVIRQAARMGLRTIAGHARRADAQAANSTRCDIHYFDQWSPNMAYILGFLFADGCVSKNLKNITINLAEKDRVFLEFMKAELKSNKPLRQVAARFEPRTGGYSKPQYGLGIGSKVMVSRLIELGLMPRKTYENHPFPEVPDNMMPHFVRGYLDGDGTINVGANGACAVGFVGAPAFIEGLVAYLVDRVGMATKSIRNHQGKTADWSNISWSSLADLQAFHNFVYPKGFGFCLERKRQKLVQWLAIPRWSKGHYYERKSKTDQAPALVAQAAGSFTKE